MRTKKRWKKVVWKKYLYHFTPRLQKDLLKIKPPKFKGQIKSTFIYGEVNTGKTVRAAFMMLHEFKRIYLDCIPSIQDKMYFVSFDKLLKEIQSTYSSEKLKESDVLYKYYNAHFLIIDDFLTTKPTDWVVDIIYNIINHRYENLKTTIITSNLSLPQIGSLLEDQRIVSRITRMCQGEKLKHWKK